MGNIFTFPTHQHAMIKNVPSNLELELLYSYDGTEGKTLTNFDCGDANLLLVYFDDWSDSVNCVSSMLIAPDPTDQLISMSIGYSNLGNFRFYNGIFSQTQQGYSYLNNGTNVFTHDNTRMVVRRIYAVRGFKTEYAVDQCPYAVGDIYTTMNDVHPSERWKNTEWEAIHSFLYGGGETGYPIGSTGGEAIHALTEDEIPAHYHDILTQAGGIANVSDGIIQRGSTGSSTSVFRSTRMTGGGSPHNNMPPYLAVYMWKRVK